MRLAALLTLLLIGGCLEARAQSLQEDAPTGGVGGNGGMGDGAIGGGFTVPVGVGLSELFDLHASIDRHALPVCSTATGCAMQCTATNSGGPWVCVDENGTTVPVTQGSGGSQITDYYGNVALEDVDDAEAPYITTGNDWDEFWTAPHTVVVTGWSTTNTAAIQTAVNHTNGVTGFVARSESGWRCIWQNAGSATATVTYGPTVGAGVFSCRKAGVGAASVYTSRSNGETINSADWDFDPVAPTGGTFRMWRGSSAGTPWRGAGESITFYDVAKTDDELRAIEMAHAGIVTDDGTLLSWGRVQGTTWQVTPSAAWPFAASTPRVTASGLHIEPNNTGYVGGSGSNWASDALAAATWTAVGTPTTTSNAASGPFSQWKDAPEADLIVDDDGAAFEGYRSVTSCGTGLEKYTVSCYIDQGTSGTSTDRARVSVVTDGTGSTTCDHTLTAGFSRYDCTATITGTPTYVRGEVLVGDDAADTGSILVSQCQCDRHGWASGPKVNNTSTGLDDVQIPNSEVSTWDPDNGDLSVVFSLDYDVTADEADNNDSFFLFDVANIAVTDHRLIMWYQQSENALKFALRGGGAPVGDSDTGFSPVSLTAGQLYVYRARWRECDATHVNHWLYLDTCADPDTCTATTLQVSDTNCDRVKADPVWGGANIGRRYSSSFGFAGHIARILIEAP